MTIWRLLRSAGRARIRRLQPHALRATHYLVPTGRLGDAEQELELALESDPLSPLAHIELVRVLIWERQFDRARAKMEAAFELWPEQAL